MKRGRAPGLVPSPSSGADPYAEARARMVAQQLEARGITDEHVLRAMAEVPRHRFVEGAMEPLSYDDRPLPIGFGQTISQPFMVARATELAAPRPGERALEVGAGSGYQAAVLGRICASVFAVEIVPELAARAADLCRELGYTNVTIDSFDGSMGWPQHAPYDVIIVSAGAPRVPVMLLDQLRDGGRLVLPLGSLDEQVLTRIQRRGSEYETVVDTKCRYVDLVGRYGVGSEPPRA